MVPVPSASKWVRGVLAHMEEHRLCKSEAAGSSPVNSINSPSSLIGGAKH